MLYLSVKMTRQQALEILHEHTKSESLRRHALQVETCVAAYARRFAEPEEDWRVTALLHDFDYEMHPEAPDHPMKGAILAERGGAARYSPRHFVARQLQRCFARFAA